MISIPKCAHSIIEEPKRRQIHSSHFRDRVVHHAICARLEPKFEARFINNSYACRKDKGHIKGVTQLYESLRKISIDKLSYLLILKADIRSYFANIPHKRLLELISRDIDDDTMYQTIQKILAAHNGTTGVGLPIGNLTSQLFANVYLNELDHFIDRRAILIYYRYMDDFVMVFDRRYHDQQEILGKIREFLKTHLYLALNPSKVYCNHIIKGMEFLGYLVCPNRISIKNKNLARLKRKIKTRRHMVAAGTISPESYKRSLISWRGILTHSHNSEQKCQLVLWAVRKFGVKPGYLLWYFFLWTLKTPPLEIRRLQSSQKNAHIAYRLWLANHDIDVLRSVESLNK